MVYNHFLSGDFDFLRKDENIMQLSDSQLDYIQKKKFQLDTQMKRVRTPVILSRPFEEYKVSPLTARNGIKILLMLTATEAPFWETERIYFQLGQRAYLSQYKSLWNHVQGLLELKSQTFIEMIKYFLEHIGNFNDLSNYLDGRLRVKAKYYTSVLDKRPIRYPQRKRGYDDKGSRRLPHEYHGEDLTQEYKEERIDRRQNINHPMLKEINETLQESVEINAACKKIEGDFVKDGKQRNEPRREEADCFEENISATCIGREEETEEPTATVSIGENRKTEVRGLSNYAKIELQ